MLSVVAFIHIIATLSTASDDYPTPLRAWMTGYWIGNPVYSPVGPFTNYSMVFRENDYIDGSSYPDNFLMVESGPDAFISSAIPDSYQQWTIFGDQITYCGLLTQDKGLHYEIAQPQFFYQPQLSSEFEVYFCADPRGGGCNTFWWQWIYYNDTNKLLSNNTVSGTPHESTLFDFISANTNDIPIQKLHRQMCVYVLGNEQPYIYNWIDNPVNSDNDTDDKILNLLNHDSRQKFKNNIPDYDHHYHHRTTYHQQKEQQ